MNRARLWRDGGRFGPPRAVRALPSTRDGRWLKVTWAETEVQMRLPRQGAQGRFPSAAFGARSRPRGRVFATGGLRPRT